MSTVTDILPRAFKITLTIPSKARRHHSKPWPGRGHTGVQRCTDIHTARHVSNSAVTINVHKKSDDWRLTHFSALFHTDAVVRVGAGSIVASDDPGVQGVWYESCSDVCKTAMMSFADIIGYTQFFLQNIRSHPSVVLQVLFVVEKNLKKSSFLKLTGWTGIVD